MFTRMLTDIARMVRPSGMRPATPRRARRVAFGGFEGLEGRLMLTGAVAMDGAPASGPALVGTAMPVTITYTPDPYDDPFEFPDVVGQDEEMP